MAWRRPLGARMKFAEKYSTDEELSTVIESCPSWSALKTKGLKKSKPADDSETALDRDQKGEGEDDLALRKRARQAFLRAVETIDEAKPVMLDESDISKLRQAVREFFERAKKWKSEMIVNATQVHIEDCQDLPNEGAR